MQVNETESETSPQITLSGDNLIYDIVLASLALFGLLAAVVVVLITLKHCYKKLPKLLKNLVLKIKSKLMWSSALRYIT